MLDASSWSAPPDVLQLNPDEVHVWCAAVNREAPPPGDLWQLLSADERAKAERFRLQKNREEFIVARGLLRLILGRYLDASPAELRFWSGPYGKLFLAAESGHEALRFNVAHSDGLILHAVSREREVGVDVERICSGWAVEDLAARFFSPSENAALRALPEDLRREGFFNCWTRKEAFLKARGDGLSQPLDEFDVSLTPGEPVALLCNSSCSPDVRDWSIRGVPPIPGYAGAVAGEGLDWELKCWAWTA